jgi:hypothetical protein
MSDLFSMESALKVMFEDSVFDNAVTDSELLDQFEEDSSNIKQEETTGGRYIETAQYFNLPAGVRAVATNDYIPVPNGPLIRNARIYLKKVQGAVEMTGDTMRRVKSDQGAFLNWSERAMPDLVKRLNNTLDRMTLGFGAGALGRVVGTIAGDGSTTPFSIEVNSAFGVTGLGPAHVLFLEGEQIVFGTTVVGSTLRGGAEPSVVVTNSEILSNGNTKLTISRDPDASGAAIANGDWIFLGDDTQQAVTEAATDRPREFMGLLGHVDDGAIISEYQEIDRADHRLWRSTVVDADEHHNPGVLDEDLIAHADDEVMVEGGGKPDLFVTSRPAIRQYWRHLRGDRVINDPRKYTGGPGKGPYIDLGDRELKLRVSRKMPHQLAFGLQTDTFKRFSLGRWEWDDTTGAVWNRVTDGVGRRDAFYAVGHLYKELSNFAPAKNYRIDNIDPRADIALESA